jgi:hypothetical protein
MSVWLGYDHLDDPPDIDAALPAPVELANSIGVHAQRLLVRSPRLVTGAVRSPRRYPSATFPEVVAQLPAPPATASVASSDGSSGVPSRQCTGCLSCSLRIKYATIEMASTPTPITVVFVLP